VRVVEVDRLRVKRHGGGSTTSCACLRRCSTSSIKRRWVSRLMGGAPAEARLVASPPVHRRGRSANVGRRRGEQHADLSCDRAGRPTGLISVRSSHLTGASTPGTAALPSTAATPHR
jgi:hypothetical protein